MTANDSKSTPKKAEDATLLERLDARIRELQEYRGIYTQAVQQTELVYQDQGLLEDQLDDQAREYIALLSEVRDEITALRAQAEADRVAVPREIVENLLAGWDEGLWGPETQDVGVPDTVVGLVDGFRAALAQAQAGAGEGQGGDL